MTSKLKAIEALTELGATPVPFVCNEDGDKDYHHLRNDKSNEYQTVLDRITHPTLDDAIEVVEGELILAEEYVMGLKSKDVPASIFWKYQGQVIALQSILTALKGLKEGTK